MGKKRITVIGEETAKKKTGHSEEKKVKSGKMHGNLTDMGAVALEEAEKVAQKTAGIIDSTDQSSKSAESALNQRKAAVKPQKVRSQRYQAAKKKIDRAKTYPLNEAVNLSKNTSLSRFKAKIELHLTVKQPGLKKQISLPYPLAKDQPKLAIATEKKAPAIHLVIGLLENKDEELAANVQAVFNAVGPKNLKKAVLCSTMGPGVKITLTK